MSKSPSFIWQEINKWEKSVTLFLANYNLSCFLLHCAVFMLKNLVTVSDIAFDLFHNVDVRSGFIYFTYLINSFNKLIYFTPLLYVWEGAHYVFSNYIFCIQSTKRDKRGFVLVWQPLYPESMCFSWIIKKFYVLVKISTICQF